MVADKRGGTFVIADRIERDVVIEAPVDVVWGVITEPEQISRWFSDSAEIDLRPGGEGVLTWKDYGDYSLRVERVEPPFLFSFRWVYPEGEEPHAGNSMLVEFTLSAEGESTRLQVVESLGHELGWSEEEADKFVDEHSRGWEKHLGELRDYASNQLRASARG
jgi:uncharacterized protein YndB with AHSA1/START domain